MAATGSLALPRKTDDATLVARVRAGDEAAFSALYKRHARAVAAVAYRMLGDDGQLDDIVQETFVVGLRRLDKLREPQALRSWLITIAVRRVRRHLARRYRQRDLCDALDAVLPRVCQSAAQEEIHSLYRSLERLPVKHRVPWMLHHIEGETLPTVAELCGTSLSSVKRYIAAANERLRRLNHGS